MSNSAAGIFRRVNDAVYWTGAVIACVALVLVSAVIPWAVYTRYVLNTAIVSAST
jgi:TRAP-type C4-dicarboxylate transport system permease small subunit